jgi:citrate synthase
MANGRSPAATRKPEGNVPEKPAAHRWATSITRIAQNEIEIRGYPVDELMGRLSFAEAIYLILRGELPSPTIGRLFGAVLVSSIDHGVTPPSTLAARNVATTGASLRASVAAGIIGCGPLHGGDIETCMRFLQQGLALRRQGQTFDAAAAEIIRSYTVSDSVPPGFGHRIHTRDPRAARLCQMAHELELDGEHLQMLRVVERVLNDRPDRVESPLPIHVDGAIAAICGDLGFEAEIGNGLFIIARTPGLVAHAFEEQVRQKRMRQIDPRDHVYDGPARRRLPQTRK